MCYILNELHLKCVTFFCLCVFETLCAQQGCTGTKLIRNIRLWQALDQTEDDGSLNVLAVQVDQQVDQCLVVAVADAAVSVVCVMVTGMGITLSQGKGFLVFVYIFVLPCFCVHLCSSLFLCTFLFFLVFVYIFVLPCFYVHFCSCFCLHFCSSLFLCTFLFFLVFVYIFVFSVWILL